jgi:hypothetical protein
VDHLARRSFSLQLLEKYVHEPGCVNTKRNRKSKTPDDQFYLDLAILFSLPTRGAEDGVPDDLQGIHAAGINTVIVVLLLLFELF